MNTTMAIAMLTILGLAFIQNISFSIVSRSRNRNNMKYHLIAAFFSNTIWFMTFRQLVRHDMTLMFFIPYVIGTMCGSLCGVRISMFIENLLSAAADGHLGTKKSGVTVEDLVAYWDYVDQPRGLKAREKPLNFRDWLKAGQPKGTE